FGITLIKNLAKVCQNRGMKMSIETHTQDVSDTNSKVSVPKWFWAISILALAWFFMDMSAFTMRVFMLDETLKGMPEAHQSIYLGMPSWVNVVFAFEVSGGIIGSVGMLLRKKWALIGFIISLLGTLSQTGYIYFLSDALNVIGMTAVIMPLVAITICVALIIFARSATSKYWIN
ncbi:MAG: hypothetical protein O6945_06195, partial [Gammaproteobacteria bacterium]|nr:hypothetical protein [Gammaproteobacteria bacterium]